MWRIVPFGSVFLYLLGGPAVAAEPAWELIQPTESRSNLVLRSTRGSALVERQGGGAQRVPLRSDELLTAIAETRIGWTAAGIREREQGTEVIIFNRGSQGIKRLLSPTPQRHSLRLKPSLVVENEELEGLAWLEGTDLSSLSVRVASWTSEGWDDVSIVAPPARGSQTGLVNAALADGSWLLVWSAFDGQDDEILWSLGRHDRWSDPEQLGKNNTVPDITPALIATADGALLAWSRMIDGQYQLLLSRFNGDGWSRPERVGPPGSLQPEFAVQNRQLFLLYRHAWPRGWAVVDLSPDGLTQRVAVFADSGGSRPVLMDSYGEGVELRWPDKGRQRARWEVLP